MRKILAAKTLPLVLIGICSTPLIIGKAEAMPVFDATNLVQNTIAAKESVQQTMELVNQYQTQLKQYQDQVTNTTNPSSYIWDDAQQTIGKVLSTVNTIDQYTKTSGSLDRYLSQYGDVAQYRNSACFSSGGCSTSDMNKLQKSVDTGSYAQQTANGASIKGIQLQQENLKKDADTLAKLQSAAENADGRQQAIQLANQLASQSAVQLMQIRTLLAAQQNAIVTRNQALADQEARQSAGDAYVTKSGGKKFGTNSISWLP